LLPGRAVPLPCRYGRSPARADRHSCPTRRSSDLAEAGIVERDRIDQGRRLLATDRVPVRDVDRGATRDPVDVAGRTGTRSVASRDRKSTRLNSSHVAISYAVFCLKKKIIALRETR